MNNKFTIFKSKKNRLIKLNRSDFMFLAFEDVVATAGIIITVRFKTKHSPEEMRVAMRYMISIYPRLRSIVEPTLFSYKIRILDDNSKRVNVLFNDIFKVIYNIRHNSEAYLDLRRSLLNEPFSLEQGLPIKIRYIPDDPMPVLLISVHHMICDGRSWGHIINSLIMYLNGKKPPLVPIDCPNMMPAFLKKPYSTVPLQIYRSFKIFREDLRKAKGKKIIHASSRPANFFGPVDMVQHKLSYNIGALSSKSKMLNCSVTALFLAALSISLGRRAGERITTNDIVGIPVAIDLRPFFDKEPPVFGNFISSFMVGTSYEDWGHRKSLIESVNAQLIRGVNQFKNKEVIFLSLIHKLSTFVGKKNYAREARAVKRRHKLFPMTCYFSNLHDLSGLNLHGEKAMICEAIATVSHHSLFVSVSSLDGELNTNFSFPEAEFTRTEIEDIIKSFETELGELFKI